MRCDLLILDEAHYCKLQRCRREIAAVRRRFVPAWSSVFAMLQRSRREIAAVSRRVGGNSSDFLLLQRSRREIAAVRTPYQLIAGFKRYASTEPPRDRGGEVGTAEPLMSTVRFASTEPPRDRGGEEYSERLGRSLPRLQRSRREIAAVSLTVCRQDHRTGMASTEPPRDRGGEISRAGADARLHAGFNGAAARSRR